MIKPRTNLELSLFTLGKWPYSWPVNPLSESVDTANENADDGELVQLRRERDLYQRLLHLGHSANLDIFLKDSLALLSELVGAERGYLELQEPSEEHEPVRISVARGCTGEQVAEIQDVISHGIMAEVIASGEALSLASAFEDSRFRHRTSVRKHKIEAVLCAPIGSEPVLGVVYLQGRSLPGPFGDEDCARVSLFAKYLSAFADRLLVRKQVQEQADRTRPFRQKLKASSMIGKSAAMAAVLKQAAAAAHLEISILIGGPSGTGKSQLAKVIHQSGPRSAGPFLEMNCAAIPDTLLESELFGALKGAHATAVRDIKGKVAAAEKGTLFLDEIAELSMVAQAKLLQLIQSKEYYPLGSSRPQKADIRIIAATNADLRALVKAKAFREDLLYRLQTFTIEMPSLQERREDVPALAEHFCILGAESHKLPALRLSPAALSAIITSQWPGNIRELAHTIEAALIRAAADGAPVIEREHLMMGAQAGGRAEKTPTFQDATREFQKGLVIAALEETNWNVVKAAELLDITRAHLYNLLRAFGITRGPRV